MPNQYVYNGTFEEQREEEDREVYNDYLRSKTDYYNLAYNINAIIYNTLIDMDTKEIEELIKNNGLKSPVYRL